MEQMKTVEINGVKFEVDMSTAKKVEEFRVGDKVKVLVKKYSDSYEVYPGAIIGFEWFKVLPTIVVAYLEVDYSGAEIKFLYYNEKTEDVEISHTDNMELLVQPSEVFEKIDKEIYKHETEIEDLKRKKEYFEKHFKQYFKTFVNEDK